MSIHILTLLLLPTKIKHCYIDLLPSGRGVGPEKLVNLSIGGWAAMRLQVQPKFTRCLIIGEIGD
uniref:Uncharacterized protein n=1 Tax=Nelumbo nucifera TaxID=4432 RepID=A0A822YFR8_NELNU|nr:TPA_asm: hypothetical protein HUJ06_011875 [Nelumbo nucifera]